MGWLHCEPEELYLPKLFRMADFVTRVPNMVAWLFTPVTGLVQSVANCFNAGPVSQLNFIARPIQVVHSSRSQTNLARDE